MQFSQGDLVKSIHIDEGGTISIGTEECDSIIISMENGQMSGVPWFEVWKDGKCVSKWNGAMLIGVKLA